MGLINKFMMKSYLGGGETELVLEPDTGRSILIKDILTTPNPNKWVNLKTSKSLVGFFRIDDGGLGSHLSGVKALESGGLSIQAIHRPTVLHEMAVKGVFKGYPVEEGQRFTLTLSDGGGIGATAIIYEEYDNGDIVADMPNGTDAEEYVYVNYGRHSTAPNAVGTYIYDSQVSPVEFPQFPFGKVVPAKKEITINALLCSDRTFSTSPGTGYRTGYYALKKGRETLIDDDLNGIFALGSSLGNSAGVVMEKGISPLGEGSHLAQRPIMFFEEPLLFRSGEELNIFASYLPAPSPGGTVNLIESEIGVIQTVREMA